MDIYYSYACRESYLVYAWLKRVEKSGQSLVINWHPFAIQMDIPNDYWNQPWASKRESGKIRAIEKWNQWEVFSTFDILPQTELSTSLEN